MVLISRSYSLFALFRIDQFANVLHDKITLLEILLGLQSPSSAGGLDDLSVGVEAFGEALVVAAVAGGTDLGVTLILQHAVQAL